MKTIITARVIDQTLMVTNAPKLASGGENVFQVELTLDSYWDGYGLEAVFWRDKKRQYRVVLVEGVGIIPWELTAEPGEVHFSVRGVSGNIVRSTEAVVLNFVQGSPAAGSYPAPLPDVYKQVLSAQGKNAQDIKVERARIDNQLAAGTVDGELVDLRVGVDGKTYASAGTAVRTQLSHHAALLNAYYTNAKVEKGQLNAVSNGQRLHAVLPLNANAIRVDSTSEYKHALQGYSDSAHTTKVYDNGWVTGGASYFELNPDMYYNVEFLRVDEANMTDADLSAVAALYSVGLTEAMEHLLATTEASATGLAEQAALYNTYYSKAVVLASGIQGEGNPYRLHVLLEPGVSHFEVIAPDGYTYGVQGYTSDVYSERTYDSGWLTGTTRHTGMDSTLYYNVEFKKADDTTVPTPDESGIIIYQSLSLTDIVDGLVNESAQRVTPCYDATQDFVRSIAHRGLSAEAPENTAPAFILAKQKGFQYVETDIQVTSDGKYVCVHDGTCEKYTNGALPNAVSTYTLAELQAQDWGAWKNGKWTGTKILTFEEFVALCKKLSLNMYIELKYTHSDSDVKYYVDYLRTVGMLDKVSWLPAAYIDNVRNYAPRARVALTGSVAPTDEWIERYKADYQTEEGEFFFDLDVSCVTQELSDKLTAAGIPLEVWTVNDMVTVETLLQMNVSGITTDSLLVGKELLSGYLTTGE